MTTLTGIPSRATSPPRLVVGTYDEATDRARLSAEAEADAARLYDTAAELARAGRHRAAGSAFVRHVASLDRARMLR